MSARYIPPFPSPLASGIGRYLLSYYTDDGVTVSRADGSGRTTFPFSQFELSPDGLNVAFIEWEQRNDADAEHKELTAHLRLQRVGSSLVNNVPIPPVEVIDFAWSPSGEGIWFSSGGSSHRRLYFVSLRTGACRALAEGVSPKPSPDGEIVAFYGLNPHGVHFLNVATSKATFVTEGMPAEWSHDSSSLSLLRTVGRAWQLFVVDKATRKVVHMAPRSPFSYWPTWLPGNRSLLFEMNERGMAGPPSQICRTVLGREDYEPLTLGPADERPRAHPDANIFLFQVRHKDRRTCSVTVQDLLRGEQHTLGIGSEPRWLRIPVPAG